MQHGARCSALRRATPQRIGADRVALRRDCRTAVKHWGTVDALGVSSSSASLSADGRLRGLSHSADRALLKRFIGMHEFKTFFYERFLPEKLKKPSDAP